MGLVGGVANGSGYWSLFEEKSFPTGTNHRTLNSTTTRLAHPFIAPITDSITKIGISTSTVTSSQSVTFGIYDTDASGDQGNLIGGTGTQASFANNTNYEVTLSSAASITAGTQYFAVLSWTGATGTIMFRSYLAPGIGEIFPYVGTYASGSWTRTASERLAIWLIASNNRGYPTYTSPYNPNPISTAHNTGTSPSELGNRFCMPFPTTLVGARVMVQVDNTSSDYDLVVYSGTTPLASCVRLGNRVATNNILRWQMLWLDTPVSFGANEEFIIGVKPTSANTVRTQKATVHSNQVLDAVLGGRNTYACSRTGSGSWSYENNCFYSLNPVFSAFSNRISSKRSRIHVGF